jgi:predicted SAM-dependent methyltransferase
MPGWLSIDLPPADLALDVLWGLPFPRGSASAVYCAHLLEHLYYPHEALRFLGELRRVIGPGGVLRIVVPDIGRALAAYARRDARFFEDRRAWWPEVERARTPLEHVLSYAGANKLPANFFGHKFGYDFDTLRLLLRDAGFGRVERSAYMKSTHRVLRVDSVSRYAAASTRGRHYSLFVDALR